MPNSNATGGRFEQELVALLPRLRRFARALAGSVHDGDDLVQSALTKALVNKQNWKEGTRLDSWMYRIIQNHWIDTVRARRLRGDTIPLESVEGSGATDGQRAAEAALSVQRLVEGMKGLPEEQRVVLALVSLEGLSYAEAAEVLEVPIGTVMSRLARARAALSKFVFGSTGGGHD